MSLETDFQLKHTNVSRPRLSHSNSQQSIAASQAASEGYYSLSENTSTESEAQGARYHTPPSHHRTPAQSHDQLVHHTQQPVTSLKGPGVARQQHQPLPPAPQSPTVSTIIEERPDSMESRKLRSQTRPDMDADSQATTPGMDNTPYIRFAIDQLTRDEEVRGSRMYPMGQEGAVQEDRTQAEQLSEEEYPVDRILSDEALGYMARDEQTKHRLSQNIPRKPVGHAPMRSGDSAVRAQQNQTPTPNRIQKDVFVPHPIPNAPLRFVPGILRPIWLSLFTFLCTAMLAVLIAAAVYSDRNFNVGLWQYLGFGDGRYFVFEYLPTLLGGLLFLWLIQVQTALQRIVPFMSLASGTYKQRSHAIFLELYPMQFLLPRLDYFRAGHPVIGLCFVAFWLFSWTIPLLASSFNVHYDVESSSWCWVAVQGVIWTVIVLYILLVFSLLTLLMVLRKHTGLRWDPRSLADIITMLERSNIVNEYMGSETFDKQEWDGLKGRADRLGYWSTTRQPNDVFHGIGEEGAPTRRYSIEDGRIREKRPERPMPSSTVAQTGHRPGDFAIRTDVRDPTVRLRYLPWYLRDSAVLAWIITAFTLLIAFLVISFVNSAVRLGFLPQVFARTDAQGFSASNFLYSFVPAIIGQFLFLVVLTFDYSFRVLRPYISLSSKGGATAETSLLADYACRLPLSMTFSALENQHYQNAILSLVSLCSVSLPILAGGCFWTQYFPDSDVVRVSADLSGYYALCFFLALYAMSLLALWSGRKRAALPHRSNNLAEIISWMYQSPLLTDRAFNRPQTKPELVARLMGSTYLERTFAQSVTSLVRPSRDNLLSESAEKKRKDRTKKDSAQSGASIIDPGKIRYGFGIHVGRDGFEHLGIDRIQRGGNRSGRDLVIWEEQKKGASVA